MTFQPGDRVERTAHGRDEWPDLAVDSGTVVDPSNGRFVDVQWDEWTHDLYPMTANEIKLIMEVTP